MKTISQKFFTTDELFECATTIGWQQSLLHRTDKNLSAPFGEADVELAVNGFRTTVLSFLYRHRTFVKK